MQDKTERTLFSGKTKWTNTKISKLISAYKTVKKRKDNGARFWDFVQKEMEKSGSDVTSMHCKIKWKELKQKYDDIKKQQAIKVTWLYYKEMDAIFSVADASEESTTTDTKQKKITSFFQVKKMK